MISSAAINVFAKITRFTKNFLDMKKYHDI